MRKVAERAVLTAVRKLLCAPVHLDKTCAVAVTDIRTALLVQHQIPAGKGFAAVIERFYHHCAPLTPVGVKAVFKPRSALGKLETDFGVFFFYAVNHLNTAVVIVKRRRRTAFGKLGIFFKHPVYTAPAVEIMVVEPNIDVHIFFF